MFTSLPLNNVWDDLPGGLRLALLIVAGAIAGTGQAPVDAPALTVLGLALGLWAMTRPRGASGFAGGWALGFGYFLATLYWIMEPFQVDAAETGLLAVPAWIIMCGGLALFWGVAGRLAKGWPPMVLCLSLTGAEVARSYLFSGFPWALVGYAWIDTPAYYLASVVGPHGVTLLTMVLALGVARLGMARGTVVVALVGVLQFAPALYGPVAQADAPTVRLIHPDVIQEDKWHPEKREGIYQRQRALTAADPPVDLVVWSETAVYLPMSIAAEELAETSNGAYVLAGAQRRSDQGDYFNSAFVIGPDGAIDGIYDKYRLVPFGEFVPFASLAARFGIFGLTPQSVLGFEAGPGPSVLNVPGVGKVQPLICYEGIFPQDVGNTAVRPDVLVLITNDAWFGTFNGPAQHMAQARARAIELGLPMVRVANRGISAVIDARGQVIGSMGLGEAGFLDVALPPPLPPTTYARWRNVPALGLAVLLAAFGFARRRVA